MARSLHCELWSAKGMLGFTVRAGFPLSEIRAGDQWVLSSLEQKFLSQTLDQSLMTALNESFKLSNTIANL